MTVKRVMGTETEYAVSLNTPDRYNPVQLSFDVVNGAADSHSKSIRWDYRQEGPVNGAAGGRRQRHRIERSVRLHNRGPQHDAAEAKRVQQPRRHVKPLARRFALHHVGQHEERQHHNHRRHRAQDDEHRAPAPEVDEEAGYGGARGRRERFSGGPDGRREADDEAHQTHRTAVLAFGVH